VQNGIGEAYGEGPMNKEKGQISRTKVQKLFPLSGRPLISCKESLSCSRLT